MSDAPRIAILGTGWGTRIQVPAFRHAGWPVTALWARDETKAAAHAAELDIPYATADWRQLLVRDDVDLVAVTTPPHTHREIAVAALEAGKHVLCEKPTALDAGEAEAMLDAARAHPDRIALIDHELRFLPERRRMKELLAAGYAGEIFALAGQFGGRFRLDPHDGWSWWSDTERGGGTLGAIGSHMIDSMTWLAGRPVTAVAATLAVLHPRRRDASGRERRVTADDAVTLQLTLGDGLPAHAELTAASAAPRVHRLTVYGSEATLVWDDGRLTGYRQNGEEDLTPTDDAGIPPVLAEEFPRGTIYLARALRRTLASGDRGAIAPAATFADGLAVQRVLDAARVAHEQSRWVEVPVDG